MRTFAKENRWHMSHLMKHNNYIETSVVLCNGGLTILQMARSFCIQYIRLLDGENGGIGHRHISLAQGKHVQFIPA